MSFPQVVTRWSTVSIGSLTHDHAAFSMNNLSSIDDPPPYEGHFTFVEVLFISTRLSGKHYEPMFHCALPLHLSSAFRTLNIQFKEVIWSFSVFVSAFFLSRTDGKDHEMESLESQKSQHMVK